MRILGVILAGGQARRMGGADKALMTLDGRPLLAHAIGRLAPQVAALALSANGDPARFAAFGLPVLADDQPLGPLSGILAGLRHAQATGHDAVLSVPVDCPFLPAHLAARLCSASEDGAAPVLAQAGRVHPATALWPVAMTGRLAGFLASGAKPRIMDFAAAQGARTADFPDAAAFANLNTPEDLGAAQGKM